jgi:PEGA domain
MNDPLLYFRTESDSTQVQFADRGDHVPADTTDEKRILVSQAGWEDSTVERIDLEALREEPEETQGIKDSVAAASALRSEIDSLSALVARTEAELSSVQETARAALEFGSNVGQRLGAIESRLEPLADLDDVRREIEKLFDALNALTREARANTDTVNRQLSRVEQLAVETTTQLEQARQRGVELGREMARLQSVQARTESAPRSASEPVDRLTAGQAADARRASSADTRARRSLTIRNVEGLVRRGRTALMANVRRSSLRMQVAKALAVFRVPRTVGPMKYVGVAAVSIVLMLMSAFVLQSSTRKTAQPIAPPVALPVIEASVPATAVFALPSVTSATTASAGSLDSATTVHRPASNRQAASVDSERPASQRVTTFVGALSIRSTPDKAEVHIDRERVGETPLVLRGLRAGSHVIWIDHDGYQRWTAGVNVPAEEVTKITVTLQAQPGR